MVKLPRLRALDRKMLRELWRMRGQLLSIGLVVATAVTTLVALRGTYEALDRGRTEYYRDYRLPDVWASLERAPESLRRRIESIPGVAAVETRVSGYSTLDLPWLDAPGQGLFISVPETRRARVSDIHLTAGRYVAPGRAGEVVVNDNFFLTNALELGDTIRAVLHGLRRELVIVGVAISPEHTYPVPPGALFPDHERYAVFWMGRSVLAPALDMEDAFDEVVLALAPGASEAAVIQRLDALLDPYGGLGAYRREDQMSFQILEGEMDQNRATGTIFPAIFLGVAAFLLQLVLNRLVATQRTEIGALKAVGYTNLEVGLHFLGYAIVAVGTGTAIGALGGIWTGEAMIGIYEEYFRFPSIEYRLSWPLVLLGGTVSLVAAALGGAGAVRRAASLPPAEAMRPEPPERFTPGWLERSGLGNALSTGGRLILRNLERRPVRAALSSLGVSFSVAIVVVGLFLFDGIDWMMDLQFRLAQREDLTVSFMQDVDPSVRYELARLEGVTRVEPYQSVPVRLAAGHRNRELAITAVEPGARLRRIVSADGRVHPVPVAGIALSAFVADALGVGRGDSVRVEVLVGRRATGQVAVADVVDDLLGTAAYASPEVLRRVTREGPRVSGAWLLTDGGPLDRLHAELSAAPAVASVASPAVMLASFERQIEESLLVSIAFIVGFASVIAVAVIYNGTRIALSERGRELASLRVLGFTKPEVARLLFGEQGLLML
ncbi:MAG TPA: FtsX-like permease family protein, partial [Longimicrobiales bacterium]|nr:FtsX-like permease family protein [Longimicrobiales bacterium]